MVPLHLNTLWLEHFPTRTHLANKFSPPIRTHMANKFSPPIQTRPLSLNTNMWRPTLPSCQSAGVFLKLFIGVLSMFKVGSLLKKQPHHYIWPCLSLFYSVFLPWQCTQEAARPQPLMLRPPIPSWVLWESQQKYQSTRLMLPVAWLVQGRPMWVPVLFVTFFLCKRGKLAKSNKNSENEKPSNLPFPLKVKRSSWKSWTNVYNVIKVFVSAVYDVVLLGFMIVVFVLFICLCKGNVAMANKSG